MAQIETYTITVVPSTRPGKVTAHSSDGHSLTTSTPLLDGARYWQALGAPSTAATVTTWSSGPGHWAPRSPIRYAASLTVMGDRGKRVERRRLRAPPLRWRNIAGARQPADRFFKQPPI